MTTGRTEMILHEYFSGNDNIVVSTLKDIMQMCNDKGWNFDACVTAAKERLIE